MRTIRNAEYQLEVIMPSARAKGCKCPFSESDFEDFVQHNWQHAKDCPAKLIENLPNPVGLMEAMRRI